LKQKRLRTTQKVKKQGEVKDLEWGWARKVNVRRGPVAAVTKKVD